LDETTYWANSPPGPSHVNVGTGLDCTILELAQMIADITGFKGRIGFDVNKPDGAPRKLLDVSRLTALGWRASISLEEGLRASYRWFLNNQDRYRGLSHQARVDLPV
jgi:GDP-L-fucose synthase